MLEVGCEELFGVEKSVSHHQCLLEFRAEWINWNLLAFC
jgi:hypothetical protein